MFLGRRNEAGVSESTRQAPRMEKKCVCDLITVDVAEYLRPSTTKASPVKSRKDLEEKEEKLPF